jgi:2-methylcitrate dehydratase PrpD
VLEAFSRALAGFRAEDAAPDVRDTARYCILDGLGAGLAGHDHPAVACLRSALAALPDRGEATVLAARDTVPALHAALLNGTLMQVHDLDEIHVESNSHPTVAVLPALLAAAECSPASGADLLAAFIGGYEAIVRIGRAIAPAQHARGWHVSSTLGSLGAAAGVARLLHVDAEGIRTAVNLAGTGAGGVRATFGSMAKHLHFGHAALNGLLAGLEARAGVTAGADTLEHPLGFVAASAGPGPWAWGPDAPLGAVREATFKRFPCCFENHSAILAGLALRADGATAGAAAVEVRVRPEILPLVGNGQPASALAARFSLAHNVALALARGDVRLADFAGHPDADRDVADLRRRVRVVPDPGVLVDEAVVAVTGPDGRARTARATYRGGAGAWTPGDLQAKFMRHAEPALGAAGARALRDLVLDLPSVGDAARVARACRPARRGKLVSESRATGGRRITRRGGLGPQAEGRPRDGAASPQPE